MAYSKLIHFDWIVNIFLWSATQSLTVLCLSGFNKPVLKFATSWFEGDKKSSSLRCYFPVSVILLCISVCVILTQSQHLTNLWHNEKILILSSKGFKTIIIKHTSTFISKRSLSDVSCVLGYFSNVSMHQNLID